MMTEVFISYSRRDKAFVRALYSALRKLNRTAWADWEDIAPAVDWENIIYQGVENANKFVFIISPDSVISPYCIDEINHAIRHNKQLVPVLCRDTDLSKLHPEVAKFQIISFCGESDFDAAFEKFLYAIDTDLDHAQFYTRLKNRAEEWQKSNCHESLLLRGAELASAEQWLADSTDKYPKPLDLHKEYVTASQEWQRQEIQRWQMLYEQSEQGRILAEKKEIKALCRSSEALVVSNQRFDGLVEAIIAGLIFKRATWRKTAPDIEHEIAFTLRQSLYGIQEFNRCQGHNYVRNICFSPDGSILASCDNEGSIKLWNLDGSLRATLEGHTDCVDTIAFSSNNEILVSASEDNTIKVWNINGVVLSSFDGQGCEISSITLSPDNQIIASIHIDGVINLWQLNGTRIKQFLGHDNGGQMIKFSPNGKHLISGGNQRDRQIKIWDYAGNLLQPAEAEVGVLDIDFYPDGSRFIITDGYQVSSFSCDGHPLETAFKEHSNQITSISFSADGTMVAAGDADGLLTISTIDGHPLKILQQPSSVTSLKFSPNNSSLIVSAGVDGVIRFWQLDEHLFQTLHGQNQQRFVGIHFSPNSQTFVTACSDNSVNVWNREGNPLKTLYGHEDKVQSVQYSPNGQLIASCSADKTIKLWNPDDSLLHTLQQDAPVWDLDFASNSQMLVSSGINETLKLWNIDGTLIKTLSEGGEHYNYCVSFSPDNQRVATGRSDGDIQVWGLEGTLIQTLRGHGRAVIDITFSPDGQFLASGSRDNTVKLWNLDGTLVHTFRGHRSFVYGISFSPCGNFIASASFDKTVKLWQLDGTLFATLSGHTDGAWRVAFSPDSQQLVSTGRDGKIILWQWNLSFDDLLEYGSQWLKDYFQGHPIHFEGE